MRRQKFNAFFFSSMPVRLNFYLRNYLSYSARFFFTLTKNLVSSLLDHLCFNGTPKESYL